MGSVDVRLLIVEDDMALAELIGEYLGECTVAEFEIHYAVRLSEALEWLTHNEVDVILSDLSIPDSHGVTTVEALIEAQPGVPVVAHSGSVDEGVISMLDALGIVHLAKGEMPMHKLAARLLEVLGPTFAGSKD